MGQIYNWLRDRGNQKAIAMGAGGLAGATLVHLGLDTRAFDSKSLYDMTESALRFIPYGIAALGMGRANAMRYSHEVGRPLTPRETIHAYLDGAVVSSAIIEGWEHVGQYIQPQLHAAVGDYAKKTFVGQGSVMDLIATTLGTGGLVAAKEWLSHGRSPREKQDK
ncbi:MAG: hypothetical protein HY514_02065 [Candidatus Aenigmarchaeota archaeon]|nr:hypothetical protein [Candidatus Aenigmarchaeota archaeon]